MTPVNDFIIVTLLGDGGLNRAQYYRPRGSQDPRSMNLMLSDLDINHEENALREQNKQTPPPTNHTLVLIHYH